MRKLLVIASLLLVSSLMYSQSGSESYPNRVVSEPEYPNRITTGENAITQISEEQVVKLNIFKIEADACFSERAALEKEIVKAQSLINKLSAEKVAREKERKIFVSTNTKNNELIKTLESNSKTLTTDNRRLDLKSKLLTILVGVLVTSTAVLAIAK